MKLIEQFKSLVKHNQNPKLKRPILLAEYGPLIGLLFVFGFLLFYQKVKNPYPAGYAGLYMLMAERIAEHGFVLPQYVPYYGSGGIPFAFPPLSFYLIAFVTSVLGVSPLTYLRFAPSFFLWASLIPMFLLVKSITQIRVKAVASTIFLATSIGILSYHYHAAGVCRGFALLNLLWALYYGHEAFNKSDTKTTMMAGLFLALTVLSHPSYAVFGIATFMFFAIFSMKKSPWDRIRTLIIIGVLVFFGSMPWWLTVMRRHGFRVFLHALYTHDTLRWYKILTNAPIDFLKNFRALFIVWPENQILVVSAILGFVFNLGTGRFFLPAWLCLTVLVTGYEGQRFVALVSAILGADALGELGQRLRAYKSLWPFVYNQNKGGVQAGLVFVLFALVFRFVHSPHLYSFDHSENAMIFQKGQAIASWANADVSPDSNYMLVSDSKSEHEWFPYILRINPVVNPFGAEWKGDYLHQSAMLNKLMNCSSQQFRTCISGIFSEGEMSVDLIVTHAQAETTFDVSLEEDEQWQAVYQNSAYVVWRRSDR